MGAVALAFGSIGGLFRYQALIRNLVAKDLKLKYRGSFLGLLWSLLNPVLMLVVYTFAFKLVLRVPTENYAYFITAGLLPWSFFAGAVTASTQAIVGNAGADPEGVLPSRDPPHLTAGRIAFGVSFGNSGNTICGTTDVADGQWHHIAVTRRRSDGALRLFVDGVLDAEGPGGVGANRDVTYRDGRAGTPNDPFLVIG